MSGTMLFIFDFDGTLADLHIPWDKVMEEVLEYAAKAGADPGDTSAHLVTIANNVSDTPERKEAVNAIFRRYEQECIDAGAYKIFPSARETLDKLKGMGHATAIASNNTKETLRQISEKENLAVDAIRGRDSQFLPKPYPDMLLSLMGRFGETKETTFFAGDNFWDEESGKAAGIKTFITKPGTLNISLFHSVWL